MLSLCLPALFLNIVGSGQDQVQFGGVVQEHLGGVAAGADHEVRLVAVAVAEDGLQHFVEVGQVGLLLLLQQWLNARFQKENFIDSLEVAFLVDHLLGNVVQPLLGVEQVLLA